MLTANQKQVLLDDLHQGICVEETFNAENMSRHMHKNGHFSKDEFLTEPKSCKSLIMENKPPSLRPRNRKPEPGPVQNQALTLRPRPAR
uniref:Uncharacterized protein n=1 Tax=Romanomermis culicivorax TaxID=13658 RepID=A0A915KL22_ROMCU